MRINGRITKWVGERGWGICNSYTRTGNMPERFFVHISNAPDGVLLGVGSRITFEVGTPRREGEFPAALAIELAPLHYHQKQNPLAVPPADPKPVEADGEGDANDR